MKQVLIGLFFISLLATTFAFESKNSKVDIIQSMVNIDPFLKLNSDNTVRFNVEAAENQLDFKSIELGIVYERFHNSIITAINNNQKPFQSNQDKADLKLFEPFFLAVQQKGALTTHDLLKMPNVSNPVSILPKGGLKLYNLSGINFSSKGSSMKVISLACNGGSIEKPAYCPSWQYASNQYSSKTAASNALTQMGYHNTFFPGCGWNYPCSVDYTKWLSVNGCFVGVFRNQAITYQSGSVWKIKFQSPEPNPEIKSYPWPSTWWGPYVVYWHQVWPQPNGQLGC